MDSRFEQARALFLSGVAHYQAGRLEQASASSQAPWPWRPAARPY